MVTFNLDGIEIRCSHFKLIAERDRYIFRNAFSEGGFEVPGFAIWYAECWISAIDLATNLWPKLGTSCRLKISKMAHSYSGTVIPEAYALNKNGKRAKLRLRGSGELRMITAEPACTSDQSTPGAVSTHQGP